MIKSIFIINKSGEVLVEKQCHSKIGREELEPVIYSITNDASPPPIIESFGRIYLLVRDSGLFIIGACESDTPTLFSAAILSGLPEILRNTMKGGFSEAAVKEDYPVVYQTIDQFLNCGYPFLDEPNVMLATMRNGSDSIDVDPLHPWRTDQKIKGPGELKVEVGEVIETIINASGRADLLMVRGRIVIQSKLGGVPKCHLSVSIPSALEDYAFHRCIDTSQYLARKFAFVPPDGTFTLMSYTAKPQIANLPLFAVPKFTWSKVGVVFEITLRFDQMLQKPLEDVKISFVIPKGISSPSLATSAGEVSYDIVTKTVKWDVNTSKKEVMILSGSASISDDFETSACDIPIYAAFTAPGFTASGLKIESVEVENAPKVVGAIKYYTQAGNYIFSGCA